MDRRLAGVVILAAVTASILVTSAISQRFIPGEAIAQPVAAPPRIGDCLVDPPGRDGALLSWSTSLPSVSTAACTGPRYGEIVDQLPEFSHTGVLDDPAAFDRCFQSGQRHIGMPDGTFDPVGPWWPAIQIQVVLIGPDLRQRAAGQNWAACLLYPPPDSTGLPGSLADPLRGSWQDGRNAGAFAVCIDAVEAAVPAGCQGPHRFEIFGTSDSSSIEVSDEELQNSCRELISDATAMPDITAGGALSAEVVPFRYDEFGSPTIGDEHPASGSAFCLVRPSQDSQRLTASLRGLGDGLVPIS